MQPTDDDRYLAGWWTAISAALILTGIYFACFAILSVVKHLLIQGGWATLEPINLWYATGIFIITIYLSRNIKWRG